jgi:hypothetical protein
MTMGNYGRCHDTICAVQFWTDRMSSDLRCQETIYMMHLHSPCVGQAWRGKISFYNIMWRRMPHVTDINRLSARAAKYVAHCSPNKKPSRAPLSSLANQNFNVQVSLDCSCSIAICRRHWSMRWTLWTIKRYDRRVWHLRPHELLMHQLAIQ